MVAHSKFIFVNKNHPACIVLFYHKCDCVMVLKITASLVGSLLLSIFAGAVGLLLSGSGFVSVNGLRGMMFAGFWTGFILVFAAHRSRLGFAWAIVVSGLICLAMPVVDAMLPLNTFGPQLDLFGFGHKAVADTLGGGLGLVCGLMLLILAYVLRRLPDEEPSDQLWT